MFPFDSKHYFKCGKPFSILRCIIRYIQVNKIQNLTIGMITGITLIGAHLLWGWYVVIVRRIDKPNELYTLKTNRISKQNF